MAHPVLSASETPSDYITYNTIEMPGQRVHKKWVSDLNVKAYVFWGSEARTSLEQLFNIR